MKYVPKKLDKTADISRGRISPWKFIKNSAIVIVVLVGLYGALGLAADALARRMPDDWERALGESVSLPQAPQGRAEADIERASRILEELLANAPDRRDLHYRLFWLGIEEPNAVAIPGGGIGVTPGLLEQIESETGLAFVLAHELGHHQSRHIPKRMGRRLLYTLTGILIFGTDRLSPGPVALEVAESGYSRRQEREADEYAIKLVYETYGDTAGSLEFFETILEADGQRRWEAYIGTHPPTERRIEYLERLVKRLEGASP